MRELDEPLLLLDGEAPPVRLPDDPPKRELAEPLPPPKRLLDEESRLLDESRPKYFLRSASTSLESREDELERPPKDDDPPLNALLRPGRPDEDLPPPPLKGFIADREDFTSSSSSSWYSSFTSSSSS